MFLGTEDIVNMMKINWCYYLRHVSFLQDLNLPFNDSLLYLNIDSFADFLLVPVDVRAVDVAVAYVNGVFHCLSHFSRR